MNLFTVSVTICAQLPLQVQGIQIKQLRLSQNQDPEGNDMRRRRNFSVNALLSGFGTLVILVLFTAGVCAALRRKIFV